MTRNKKYALFGVVMIAGIPAAHAVDFGAFGDVGYQGTSENNTADSFVQGQFDLYGTQQIDPKTRAFVEIVFEDGGDGYVLDLERLNLTREISSNFSLSLGRYHTPIGYWNTAYHHGALIQDTVLRPTFLDFEDGNGAILPMHLIGLMGMGKVPSSAGELNYSLMLGNRSSLNTNGFTAPGFARTEIDVNNVADKSDQKMFGARLVFKSSRIPLEVGVFGLHNPIAESGAGAGAAAASVGSELIAQTVYGGHFRYATPRFDVMGETYSLSNDDKAGNTGKHKAAAYYVQFGYRTTDTVKLIYRFEDVDFVAADPYFQYLGTPEGSRHVVDLRYDIDDTNALKFEIVRFEPVNSTVTKSYNFYAMQWAFLTL